MKQIHTLVRSVIVCGIALALASAAHAQTQGSAKVVKIKGSARYTTGGGAWEPLKVGMLVKPGTVIQTGVDKGSYVDLVLSEGEGVVPTPAVFSGPSTRIGGRQGAGSTPYAAAAEQNAVRLWENTLMSVDKLNVTQTGAETVTDTALDLKSGRLFGSVKKMSAASKYEIKLPNGVAGIRGTVFEVSTSGVLKVLDGQVVLAIYNPVTQKVETVVLNAGESYNPQTNIVTALTPSERQLLQQTESGLLVTRGGETSTTITINSPTEVYVSPTGGDVGELPTGARASK